MIIGFTGKKQSGKTTCCGYLDNFSIQSFKGALTEELKQNFPDLLQELSESYEMPLDDLFLEKPSLVRKLMQNYGTDVRRKDDDNYWTNRWLERAKFIEGNIAVDDVRFLNEAKAVKDMGGVIIRVVRPSGNDNDQHISEVEQEQIEADYEIINDGTLAELRAEIRVLLKDIKW